MFLFIIKFRFLILTILLFPLLFLLLPFDGSKFMKNDKSTFLLCDENQEFILLKLNPGNSTYTVEKKNKENMYVLVTTGSYIKSKGGYLLKRQDGTEDLFNKSFLGVHTLINSKLNTSYSGLAID